jgi:pulcherriminic acid synthase
MNTNTLPNLFSPELDENPYPFYRQLRDEAPLYFDEALNAYIVSRYADVDIALKDPAFTVKNYEFQSEPLHGRTFIQMDGQEHTNYRNVVAPAMRGHELATKLMPMISRTAQELYLPWQAKTEADFTTEFAARFPVLVIVGMLGLDKADEPHFLRWYRTFVDFIADLGRTPEITAAAFRTKEEITAHLLPIIAHKRQHPADDMLSAMCHSTIDGVRMSDDEIKAFVSLLITAGGESTDKMLSLMLRNLLQHPEQLEAVRSDRSLIDAAFAESMRFSPVTHRLMRITDREVTLPSGTIPAGSQVILLLGAAQHDERHFNEPHRFNIFRQDLDVHKAYTPAANHIAFGMGRHFCVGAMLARAEIQVAFNQLLDLAPKLRPAYNQPPQEHGLFTRGLASLPIRWD